MNFDASPWNLRRVGVIGAGAMGLSLAAVLGTQVPVVVVCRNAQRAERLRHEGATVCGRIVAHSRPAVVENAADLVRGGGVSAIFVATKTTAIDAVAAELAPLITSLGDQPSAPFLVSFQNGIEPGRQLIASLKDPRVLRMVLDYGARLRDDGVVEVLASNPPHLLGCLDPAYAGVCSILAGALSAGGLHTQTVADIEPHVWRKGIVNAAMNPVAALTDASVGEVLDSPARDIVERLVNEGMEVALAEGIDLGADARARIWRIIEGARPHTPSMVQDIRAGRQSEVGQLNRQVIAHAKRLGVLAPTHEMITALIAAFDWRVFCRSSQLIPLAV